MSPIWPLGFFCRFEYLISGILRLPGRFLSEVLVFCRETAIFASQWFPLCGELKGNAVRIGNSSRCCEFQPFGVVCRGIPSHWSAGPGRRRARNESEDLPCTIGCLLLRRKGVPEVAADLKPAFVTFQPFFGADALRTDLLRLPGDAAVLFCGSFAASGILPSCFVADLPPARRTAKTGVGSVRPGR